MDTSGFYKLEESQLLLYAPNTVMFPISIDHLSLERNEHENYTYPVHGWYWFDTEEEARIFFDLPLELAE